MTVVGAPVVIGLPLAPPTEMEVEEDEEKFFVESEVGGPAKLVRGRRWPGFPCRVGVRVSSLTAPSVFKQQGGFDEGSRHDDQASVPSLGCV